MGKSIRKANANMISKTWIKRRLIGKGTKMQFAFGKNWMSYAQKINDMRIEEAVKNLCRLLGTTSLEGESFFDIGSGSGLHSLAALRLGAARVQAIDIDADSVTTTETLLKNYAPKCYWQVSQRDVFDLDPARDGQFDIVYAWGVLHHTGDIRKALRVASALVRPGGRFVFALYRRIWMDFFWKWEKSWYSRADVQMQERAMNIYIFLFKMARHLSGRSFESYVLDYHKRRGMDFYHDVHDWMGGYPYESISAGEVHAIMESLGFERDRVFADSGGLFGRKIGLFSSGCDEYVYRRK